MTDVHGNRSKILQTEKLAPVLEGVGDDGREDGPAWEKSFSRSTERVGVGREGEDQHQGQDRVSDVSAMDPLTMTSTSNSKPDLSTFGDDTEQASASNGAGSGLTNEIKSANGIKSVGKRGGVSETYSMEQSVRGGLGPPTAIGSDAVDISPRRSSVEQNNATSFHGGVSRQRGDDAERPGLSTECRWSASPENGTSALLLAEEQTRGAQGSVARAKSCTIQLDDSKQEGRTERTSQPNALGTTEQASPGEINCDFHALLREAMQQSDAELAAEKECTCTFKRQLSLPALAEHSPSRQCGSPLETSQLATTTSNIAEDYCRKDCGSGDNDRVSSAARMDGPSSFSAPPTPPSETAQGQWVRYLSPEGHPYLYNEVTGSSQWANPSEEELLQVRTAVEAAVVDTAVDAAVDTAADTAVGTTAASTAAGTAVDRGRGTASKMRVTERADANDKDIVTYGTGSIGVDGEGREQVVEEGSSACTIEASQTSQDTFDPDARNSAGETAMHLAATQHSVRDLRLLLTGGAHVNATDEQGRTPLHVACESCHESTNDRGSDQARECVELLLSHGAMEDACDAKGQTPLHISALVGNLGAAQALIVAGATASADVAGNSPLHLAAAQGHSEIIQLLVLGNRACDTAKSSSVASEEASSPKLAYDERPGSSAATELITEETDASGSVNETRYPPAHRPPRSNDRYLLDRAEADSISGDYLYGVPALQTPDNLYQHNATRTSRQKQQRGMTGAERRAQSETGTDVEDLTTAFGADIPTKLKRPENLSPSHPAGSPEAAVGLAFSDGSPSCRVVSTSYRDCEYLARSTETMLEETEAVEYRRGSHEGRRERGTPVETKIETRHAPTVSVSARAKAKESRRSWDGGSRNRSLPRRRHDQLGRECDHAEVGRTGLDKLDMRGKGDEGDSRQNYLYYDHVRQRPEGREGKASRRSRRRQGSDWDDQAVPWPEALPADIYEETVGAVLAARGEDSGAPPYSALTEALFAACVASRFDDAAAVLRLLEIQGGETPNAVDEGRRTPLHHACRRDDVSLVRLLCQARADPDARDFQGNSPLMVAAATGSTSCVRFLLQGGIDPHDCNELGDTPLHLAAWHGNLSCVKALVGGGARLNQRNRNGFTAREGLVAGPTFSRGRPPKVMRATLKFMECAEASVTQPKLPTRAFQDDYDSDFTAVTAASCTSPARSNDNDISGSNTGIPRGQAIYNSEAMKGVMPGCPSDTRTPVAFGDREREGKRNWERWKPREEKGDRETSREGDAIFRRAQRRDSNTEECLLRKGNLSRAEETQLRDPYGPFGGEYTTNSALGNNENLAVHFEPSRRRYSLGYSVAGSDFSANQAVTQVDFGVGEYDTSRRYERTTARDNLLDDSSESYGSRHRSVGQESTPNDITQSRTGGGVWSAVGRAFDYMIGGGGSRDARNSSGSNEESDDCALIKPPSDHPTWRPPTDSEVREETARVAPSSSSKPMPREGSAGATCADTVGDSRQVDTPLETEPHDTKVPLSLTPMQPPADVLAAMKKMMATGQRQQFSAPPADVAAAIGNAVERRQRDYVL